MRQKNNELLHNSITAAQGRCLPRRTQRQNWTEMKIPQSAQTLKPLHDNRSPRSQCDTSEHQRSPVPVSKREGLEELVAVCVALSAVQRYGAGW